MVYMSFPHSLTEEEKSLQKKYAELRKKKKILSALRAPKPEPKEQNKEALKRGNEDAADNTEQAKKLLKSGAIKLAVDKKDTQTFKRSKRQKDTEKSAVAFQPFSPTHSSENEEDISRVEPGRPPKMKGLYESFVSSKQKIEREQGRREPKEREPPPKRGNTIHVFGYGITEDILRKVFSNCGRIVNVTLEKEKNTAFVTFEKMESADQAINEFNDTLVSEVKIRVTMARRQPTFEGVQDPSSSSWSTIAASHSQKGTHQDSRLLVTYDAEDIF